MKDGRLTRDRDLIAASTLLVAALLFGGAGIRFPRLELLIDLTAVAVILYFIMTKRSWALDRPRLLALLLLGLVVALPIFQLLPLPPALWERLPGRDVAATLDPQLGMGGMWRPLTLDVEGTIRAAIGLAPAAAMFLACLFLKTPQRVALLRIVLGFALFGALIGGIQLATGGRMTPYPSAHLGYPIGLFVNRNHQAALALIAIPIAGALAALAPKRKSGFSNTSIFFLAAIAILAITVIGTTSRMGTLLLPIALLIAFLTAFAGQSLMRFVAPSVLGAGFLTAVVITSGVFTRTMSRVASLDDARYSYWTDVSYALRHYHFAGTGLGTFVPVYQSVETLDNLAGTYLNHAHNDYLELALEAGWPAFVLVLAFLVFLGASVYRLVKQPASPQRRVSSIAALTGILIILGYSLTDYPLRMPALSTVFALLCALLLPAVSGVASDPAKRRPRRRKRRSAWRRWALPFVAVGVGLGLSALMVQSALSAHALLRQQYDRAARWAVWSTAAAEKQADTLLLAQRPNDAIAPALRAYRLSPLSVSALRTLGIATIERGERNRGDALMSIAAGSGWRDPLTQLWTIQTAIGSGEADKAAQRAEAMFRLDTIPAAALDALGTGPAGALALDAFARRLARDPPWRSNFMHLGAEIQPSEMATFIGVLQRLSNSRSPASADELAPFIKRALATGRPLEAKSAWRLTHRAALITNGGFDAISGSPGSFLPRGWSIQSGSNPAIVVVRQPGWAGGLALRIFGNGASNNILSQRLLLDPGTYTLDYMVDLRENPQATIGWRFRCGSHGAWIDLPARVVGSVGGWQQLQVHLGVPDQDCADEAFALHWMNGSYRPTSIWIDSVQIRPATAPAR